MKDSTVSALRLMASRPDEVGELARWVLDQEAGLSAELERRVRSYLDRLRSKPKRVCRLCSQPIPSRSDLEIDHVIPVVRGGLTVVENLQATHLRCNRSKGAHLQ